MGSSDSGLVPVHIGQPEPGSDWEKQLRARREQPGNPFSALPPMRVPGDVAWAQNGLTPRWLGMESSDCPAAVQPGAFFGGGHEEYERFCSGAQRRGEVALVLAVVGNAVDSGTQSVFVGDVYTSVSGRPLPTGSWPEIAEGLEGADRDLAIRLLTRPKTAPWWRLRLQGAALERGDRPGAENRPTVGELQPILVDSLGAPVVAAWTSPSGDQRWYLIPDDTRWDTMLGWLVQRALPQYVPAALRRARSPFFVDPDLQTDREQNARQSLEDLEANYSEERQRLERELQEAKDKAAPVRYGLLYGSGSELVEAVAQVLAAAGLSTVDLDAELGGTKSADLLVSVEGGSARLVEVKGVSGPAQENLVGHLQRHLETWPKLRPEVPVSGGVLIVNYQHKLHPSERSPEAYSRPEFVASLESSPVTLIGTVQLFNWWRSADWTAIRTAVLGTAPASGLASAADQSAGAGQQERASGRRRWLGRRSGGGR